MAYKLNSQDENPLWRKYMDNVDMNNTKYLKEVKIKNSLPSSSFSILSEEEFLDKLKTDEEFREKWG
jgi:hypothetical protein